MLDTLSKYRDEDGAIAPQPAQEPVAGHSSSTHSPTQMENNRGLTEVNDPKEVPCWFLTGSAGTGKTFRIRELLAEDPNYGQMTATTGIAAINLGTITLNSALSFFDTESLEENLITGRLERKLKDLWETGAKNLIIDEVSMMASRQLDYIYEALRRVNEQLSWKSEGPMGLVLTGDFCQLPPVKARWAFEAGCWDKFDQNTTRLTKCWRQSDERFLEALGLIRSGKGHEGAEILKAIGVEFGQKLLTDLPDTTTIIAMNDRVEGFNLACHIKVGGPVHRVKSERWGQLRSEWKWEVYKGKQKGIIPLVLELKVGAYVMILANDSGDARWSYVNGDCGNVENFDGVNFGVRLKRTGEVVQIGPLTRENQQKDAPAGYENRKKELGVNPEILQPPFGSVYFNRRQQKWVTGGIRYYPLRLAYATTVHRSQGLSLDSVQIDCFNHFFGSPAMAYVALSRARSPQGLRIVGTPELLAERVKTDPKVLRWL